MVPELRDKATHGISTIRVLDFIFEQKGRLSGQVDQCVERADQPVNRECDQKCAVEADVELVVVKQVQDIVPSALPEVAGCAPKSLEVPASRRTGE